MIKEIGTDEVLKKYGISKYKLNKLMEYSPEVVGFLRTDSIRSGGLYINKHIFNADIETTKEDIERKLAEIKAEMKANGETASRPIIYSCKSRLRDIREREMERALYYNYDNHKRLDRMIREELEEREIAFELKRQVGRYEIYKSKKIHLTLLMYEHGNGKDFACVGVYAYKYEIGDELEGIDYELDGVSILSYDNSEIK